MSKTKSTNQEQRKTMRENKEPKKIARRKFLLQAGGGTLAVGFGAGLTSCGGGGGEGSGPGTTIIINLPFSGVREVSGQKVVVNPQIAGEINNNNNNSGSLTITYDSLSDTHFIENTSDEGVVICTYDVTEIDGAPEEINDVESILGPGQSFSYIRTSEYSGVLTNTSDSGIDLGNGWVLPPEESIDFSA